MNHGGQFPFVPRELRFRSSFGEIVHSIRITKASFCRKRSFVRNVKMLLVEETQYPWTVNFSAPFVEFFLSSKKKNKKEIITVRVSVLSRDTRNLRHEYFSIDELHNRNPYLMDLYTQLNVSRLRNRERK